LIDVETQASLTPTMINTLASVVFQQATRRREHPFTYMEMGLRTKQKRNTIAWDLHHLHRKGLIQKGQHTEKYSQKNGFTGQTAICERTRTIQLPSDELMARKRELDAEARRERAAWKKAKIAEKRKRAEEEKARKQASLSGTTPRQKPPAIYDSDRGSKSQITPNLGLLEALFEENKIRSYKMDGDLRNRRLMARVLKSFKTADLILAVTLFTRNRFLMDANAHGWRVARANALRNEGQEPWANGKSLNGYQDWCPSQVWFVRNLHKILAGDYTYRTREERARMREEVEAVSEAPDHPLTPLKPSLEALAFAGKKQREKEAQEAMELEARRDREAAHKGKSYWRDLSLPDRAKLEARFIEAIEKGETTYPATTNTRDRFFKMMKESMLLTWLGHQLAPIQDERKDHAS
jgi:hypothetical protein